MTAQFKFSSFLTIQFMCKRGEGHKRQIPNMYVQKLSQAVFYFLCVGLNIDSSPLSRLFPIISRAIFSSILYLPFKKIF